MRTGPDCHRAGPPEDRAEPQAGKAVYGAAVRPLQPHQDTQQVVLPAPDGAMRPVTCPTGSTAEKSRSTGFPAKDLHRFRITMSSMAHILSIALAPRRSSARNARSKARLTSTITRVQANRSGVSR